MNEKYEYRWWRVDSFSPWEPIRIKRGHDGDTVKFIGESKWSWKKIMGGEFGDLIPQPKGK
jgi:hypothetical protein